MKLVFLLSTLPLLAKAQVCEICGCPTCPDGLRVSNPDALYDIPVEYQPIAYGLTQAKCSDIEGIGLQGIISSSDCVSVQLREDLRTVCGCPAIPPPPTSAPIVATTTMPVVAPIAPSPVWTTTGPAMPTNDDIDIDEPIVDFILIHAPTNTELVSIHDKDVIALEDLDVDSAEFNIKVLVDERVRSVYFEETKRAEGDRPFAFCGDEMGDYFTCDIRVGKKQKVTVVPYTGDYQTGSKLQSQSISFKIISSEDNDKDDKDKNNRDKGDGERAPAPSFSPAAASPSRDYCDMVSFLDKVELFIFKLNDRIAKIGFPSIKLDFVSGDMDNGDCGIQIHFGMNLKTKLFRNDVELGGSGILAGFAVNDKQYCVEKLRVVEFGVDGPLAQRLLEVVEKQVLKKTVSEVITDALDNRIGDFCT